MMKPDAAIGEIREVRHRISERFGHDTKAFLDHYRALEKKYKDRMLSESPGLMEVAEERDERKPGR